MSVQAGIWNFDGRPVDQEFLVRVSRGLAKYGPDAETVFIDGPIGILYRSFHTTFESRVERQPHTSHRGHVITWDGRLDNRHELVLELLHELRDDRSDVAIVAAAFDLWGTNCFDKLIGDWAVVIWNPVERRLTLARDYIGTKQLFYRCRTKTIQWCNHLAPLVLSGDNLTLCDEYLAGYFGYWPDAHLTPYREISSVRPGHFVNFTDSQARSHSYWIFNHNKLLLESDSEYEEHFRHLFRQAVQRRLRTDSPVLAELSGGLDSSSIVCMADDILAKHAAESPSVDTFSFYDLQEPDEEDFLYFPIVEQRRGRAGHHAELHGIGDTFSLECHSFTPTPGFSARQELRTAQADVIRQGNYRVLLSGLGGDQFLGAVSDPDFLLADLILYFRPLKLANELASWSLATRQPWIHLMARAVTVLIPTRLRASMTPMAIAEPWLNPEFARKHRISERLLSAPHGSWYWRPSTRKSFQMLTELSGQLTAFSPTVEEKRYPFLDRTLVEFLISVPTDQLARSGQDRSLMRRALVGLLPEDIRYRQSKSGTGRCAAVTLQKHWHTVEALLDSSLIAHDYIDVVPFRSALIAMKNGREPNFVVQLLRAVSLELWLRNLTAAGVIAPSTTDAIPIKTTYVNPDSKGGE